jgi:hypothetical protein
VRAHSRSHLALSPSSTRVCTAITHSHKVISTCAPSHDPSVHACISPVRAKTSSVRERVHPYENPCAHIVRSCTGITRARSGTDDCICARTVVHRYYPCALGYRRLHLTRRDNYACARTDEIILHCARTDAKTLPVRARVAPKWLWRTQRFVRALMSEEYIRARTGLILARTVTH